MKLNTTCGTALLATAALFSLGFDAQANGGKIAIKAGRVITMNGAEIKDGVIVIEDGRIKEVAAGAATR